MYIILVIKPVLTISSTMTARASPTLQLILMAADCLVKQDLVSIIINISAYKAAYRSVHSSQGLGWCPL